MDLTILSYTTVPGVFDYALACDDANVYYLSITTQSADERRGTDLEAPGVFYAIPRASTRWPAGLLEAILAGDPASGGGQWALSKVARGGREFALRNLPKSLDPSHLEAFRRLYPMVAARSGLLSNYAALALDTLIAVKCPIGRSA